ncbi:MAG: hypothetical protein K9M75_13255 [Phycisphaerae bacterium]|nr:hypothetical protein [Phycisphaerae bacterium]
MDPKKIYELILAGREDSGCEIDCGFDVSEIIEEFTAVDRALKELEAVAGEFEDQTAFNHDFMTIDRKLRANKMAIEFEGVDAAYEI